jgi:hypothetical protein
MAAGGEAGNRGRHDGQRVEEIDMYEVIEHRYPPHEGQRPGHGGSAVSPLLKGR